MARMPAEPSRLRLTVLGCSSAAPHPDTPAAGYLVEWADTAILFDVGQGVVRNLQAAIDPHRLAAVVVGHMHADHYLDLAGMRYLFPWGEDAPHRLPVHLPPAGRQKMDALADAISERRGFFDAAYDIAEYDPDAELRIGPLGIRFHPGQHYVPAWGVEVTAPDGARLVYTGDTGPIDSMAEFARGADLFLVESTLRNTIHDDPRRGHLMPEEAIHMAHQADARATLLVHYLPGRRHEIEAMCAADDPSVRLAVAGLVRTVVPAQPVATADGAATTRGPALS